jgi:hypothetical protein
MLHHADTSWNKYLPLLQEVYKFKEVKISSNIHNSLQWQEQLII